MDTGELLVAGEATLARARQACDGARALCSSISWLALYARALRRRQVRWIRGGADLREGLPEAGIRARLRSLIDEGVLPRAEPRQAWSWTSPGSRRCTACGLSVVKGELEYELTTAAAPGILRFHLQCFRLYAGVVAEHGGDGGITRPP
jgi:hypothetical protein